MSVWISVKLILCRSNAKILNRFYIISPLTLRLAKNISSFRCIFLIIDLEGFFCVSSMYILSLRKSNQLMASIGFQSIFTQLTVSPARIDTFNICLVSSVIPVKYTKLSISTRPVRFK